jgi:thiol-disulfide isomerase/thioredoxin
MTKRYYMALALPLIAAIAAIGAVTRPSTKREIPSLSGATAWLNTQPLTSADLRGKVVLVEFWTYTCINWRRTLPYVRAWADRYKEKGLVVIGVSTPATSISSWDRQNLVETPFGFGSSSTGTLPGPPMGWTSTNRAPARSPNRECTS